MQIEEMKKEKEEQMEVIQRKHEEGIREGKEKLVLMENKLKEQKYLYEMAVEES